MSGRPALAPAWPMRSLASVASPASRAPYPQPCYNTCSLPVFRKSLTLPETNRFNHPCRRPCLRLRRRPVLRRGVEALLPSAPQARPALQGNPHLRRLPDGATLLQLRRRAGVQRLHQALPGAAEQSAENVVSRVCRAGAGRGGAGRGGAGRGGRGGRGGAGASCHWRLQLHALRSGAPSQQTHAWQGDVRCHPSTAQPRLAALRVECNRPRRHPAELRTHQKRVLPQASRRRHALRHLLGVWDRCAGIQAAAGRAVL